MFGNGDYNPFLDTITEHGDYWLVSNDFDSYLEAERLADEMFMKNHAEWVVKSMLTTSRMGKFSSDRAVAQYAEESECCRYEMLFSATSNPSLFPRRRRRFRSRLIAILGQEPKFRNLLSFRIYELSRPQRPSMYCH
jgi:hypothetical protein